ncbi:03e0a9b2-d3f9-48ca-96ae-3081f31c07e6 [Thermothielavioides terrestris]|uniref:03e0a9b2-d3f9-48ca-96ae-3081f31c07e6 n=1 Tax=Thermothielavioides terrestris TaxID=2587410 RepID=A0A446B574_9PEZI|nr:03e0a9b2-d3f9-48ca-96ae-3081f31c07e6 [Thermothielavioides terrestris]
MAAFPDMGPPYVPSRPVARTSSSPDPGIVEDQLVAGMTALQSHDGDCKRAYLPSHWSGCLGAPPGTDEFEHYALHSSPALSSLSCPESSAKSSPRSWDSPEQLGPTPWEAATEQLHNRYHGLDPQLSGVPYVATSHSTEVPTSYPTDAAPFVPTQDFHHPETGSQHVRSQTEPYPAGYRAPPRDGYPTPPDSGPPLSTCTAAGDSPSPADEQRSSQGSKQQPDPKAGRTSVPSGGADDSDKDESYAQLIYRAFMSHPRRAMTLQEIYQWFRENTDKGKDDSKGWQNSVRHNLSMNGAFTRRDRRPSNAKDGDAEGGNGNGSGQDGKKSSEWYLEPWACASGVQSTTRYRGKSNQRRCATSHGISARVYRGYSAHRHSYSSSGRKGAANNNSNSLFTTGRVLRTSTRQGVATALRGNANALNLAAAAANHALPAYPFPAAARAAFIYPNTSTPFYHSPSTTSAATITLDYEHHPHNQQQQQQPYEYPYEYTYPSPSPQLYHATTPSPSPASASTATATTALARAASEPIPAGGAGGTVSSSSNNNSGSSGSGNSDDPTSAPIEQPVYPAPGSAQHNGHASPSPSPAPGSSMDIGMNMNMNINMNMGVGVGVDMDIGGGASGMGVYDEVLDHRYPGWGPPATPTAAAAAAGVAGGI